MDQYLLTINTIFSGMNIHLPAILMWTTGVLLVLTHCQVLVNISQNTRLLCPDGWELRLSPSSVLCSRPPGSTAIWAEERTIRIRLRCWSSKTSPPPSGWDSFTMTRWAGEDGWWLTENEMTWDEIWGGCQYLPVLAAISPVYLCQSLLLVAF